MRNSWILAKFAAQRTIFANIRLMLEFKNVSVSLPDGNHSAHFSLIAEKGELVCIHGGKHTGKSEVLLSILGLRPLRSGFITFDGELITHEASPYFRRMMAYVPQYMPEGRIEIREVCRYLRLDVPNDLEDIKDKAVSSFSEQELQAILLRLALEQKREVVLVDNAFPTPKTQELLGKLAETGAEVIFTHEDDTLPCDKLINLEQ